MSCLVYKTQKIILEDWINPWLDIIALRLNNVGNIIKNDTQNCIKMNNAYVFLGKIVWKKKQKYRKSFVCSTQISI